MSTTANRDASAPKPTGARTGIFRTIAVERYSGPLEADMPVMLAPFNRTVLAVAIVLLGVACVLLWMR